MQRFRLPAAVFLLSATLLIFVQLKVERPMLLLERFFTGGGWLQIFLIASYAALVAWKMQDPAKVATWRKYTWLAFSLVFFSQLLLGLVADPVFLMTGKLHLPVPMMILAGPLYRGHTGVMTILFLSTVLLSGPAWCSHLCYFGALDNLAAGKKNTAIRPPGNKWALKASILSLVIIAALLFRFLKVPVVLSALLAGGFGVAGLLVIALWSRRQGRMLHCTTYCPIGTIVSFTRYVNPFRLKIDQESCTSCMVCTTACKYDALNRDHILAQKPGLSCTLCGDCLNSCRSGSLQYCFLKLSPEKARRLYLFITISLHACTMALARI